MAQLDDRKYSQGLKTPRAQNSPGYRTPTAQTSPTIEQLLIQGDSGIWPSTPSSEGDHSPQRKSVLTKVKEKAKKLRHTLSNKKKHGVDNDSSNGNTTPSWGVRLDDDKDNEDPEYLGAPMYESELAPENYKETARQHPREVTVPSEKHIVESNLKNDVTEEGNIPSPSKTMTEKLGTADTAVPPDATHTIASRIAGLTVETPALTGRGNAGFSPHTCDKGISVKEYLMHKFEPGEDERALSQVITDAISPKMVEKMKEAVTSFLRTDEIPSISITKITNSSGKAPDFTNPNTSSNISISTTKTASSSSRDPVCTQKSISPTSKTNLSPQDPNFTTNSKDKSPVNANSAITDSDSISQLPISSPDRKLSSYIPISTSAHGITQEEDHGRVLQAN